jgi:hypothetical protein
MGMEHFLDFTTEKGEILIEVEEMMIAGQEKRVYDVNVRFYIIECI